MLVPLGFWPVVLYFTAKWDGRGFLRMKRCAEGPSDGPATLGATEFPERFSIQLAPFPKGCKDCSSTHIMQ